MLNTDTIGPPTAEDVERARRLVEKFEALARTSDVPVLRVDVLGLAVGRLVFGYLPTGKPPSPTAQSAALLHALRDVHAAAPDATMLLPDAAAYRQWAEGIDPAQRRERTPREVRVVELLRVHVLPQIPTDRWDAAARAARRLRGRRSTLPTDPEELGRELVAAVLAEGRAARVLYRRSDGTFAPSATALKDAVRRTAYTAKDTPRHGVADGADVEPVAPTPTPLEIVEDAEAASDAARDVEIVREIRDRCAAAGPAEAAALAYLDAQAAGLPTSRHAVAKVYGVTARRVELAEVRVREIAELAVRRTA